jgi:hypothetical protein
MLFGEVNVVLLLLLLLLGFYLRNQRDLREPYWGFLFAD